MSDDLAARKHLKPIQARWKSVDPSRCADPRASRAPSTEADLRTLIIGPGISATGKITSCNQLIVEKAEANRGS